MGGSGSVPLIRLQSGISRDPSPKSILSMTVGAECWAENNSASPHRLLNSTAGASSQNGSSYFYQKQESKSKEKVVCL